PLADRVGGEGVGRARQRPPPPPPLTPRFLKLADELLLLGVDTDRRLARGDRRAHPLIDQPKLRIAIGMLRAFQGLAIGLQAVPERTQQLSDRREVHVVTLLTELGSA